MALEVREMLDLPAGDPNFRKRGRDWLGAVCNTMRTIEITALRNAENLNKITEIITNQQEDLQNIKLSSKETVTNLQMLTNL